jgi:hypothetical protein
MMANIIYLRHIDLQASAKMILTIANLRTAVTEEFAITGGRKCHLSSY